MPKRKPITMTKTRSDIQGFSLWTRSRAWRIKYNERIYLHLSIRPRTEPDPNAPSSRLSTPAVPFSHLTHGPKLSRPGETDICMHGGVLGLFVALFRFSVES